MPAGSLAQCRPTVARQLPISASRLRIADLARDRVPSRPCRTADGQRRGLKAYAGPLESRRRMGKRHMTGAIPAVPFDQPLWHFVVATSTDARKWEPPTTAAQRREKSKVIRPGILFDRFIQWLEGSSPDELYINPSLENARARLQQVEAISTSTTTPTPAPIPPSHRTSAISYPIPSRNDVKPDEPLPLSSSFELLPREILELRQSICDLATVDHRIVNALCGKCCAAIAERIKNGNLSATGLNLAFDPLDERTMALISKPKTIRKVTDRIRRTIFRTLAITQNTPGRTDVSQLWLSLAEKICGLGVAQDADHLFRMMMDGVPECTVSQFRSEHLFDFIIRHVKRQAGSDFLRRKLLPQTGIIGKALEKLTTAQHKELDDLMRAHLEQNQICPSEDRRLRFSWLLTKAYNPRLTKEMVVETYRALMPEPKGLKSIEIWLLLGARLPQISKVVEEHRWRVRDSGTQKAPRRWNDLFSAVLSSKQREVDIQELKYLLRETGGFRRLKNLFMSSGLVRQHLDIIETLAVLMDDHRLAYGLYEELGAIDPRLTKRWSWQAWTPYIERMIQDPNIEPRVWEVLNFPSGRQQQIIASDQPQDVVAMKQLLKRMAASYMEEANRFSERQLLRRLDLCATRYRAVSGGVPLEMVALLTDVICRDLEKGNLGRTARLIWVVQMVAEHDGVPMAERTLETIREWRRLIEWAQRSLPQNTGAKGEGATK
ncbi:hypothetical protein HJFPF1_01074 [Paramyrothecium foliicola]|nr:hypothetical protein HJFPF1_01074 [Paramyrothecium foliicola]